MAGARATASFRRVVDDVSLIPADEEYDMEKRWRGGDAMATANRGRRDHEPDDLPVTPAAQLPLDPTWEIEAIDAITGEPLTDDERAYRGQIRSEAARGLIAMDALYHERVDDIHQPIADEHGEVIDEGDWELRRGNNIILRISIGQLAHPASSGTPAERVDALAVDIAQKALGVSAARVMRHLYTLANDPPYWRRPEVTIRLNETLDSLGYARDKRGIHYSRNRQRLSQTLLALQMTQIGVQREDETGAVGYIGSLISGMEYRTSEKVGTLSPIEVFQRGLPEDVTVQLNARWYRLRDRDGRPLETYMLVPRGVTYLPLKGAGSGTPYTRFREYLATTSAHATARQITLRRDTLLGHAGITDKRRRQATMTLTKLLDRLCAEGVLADYAPRPLPLEPTANVTLKLPS